MAKDYNSLLKQEAEAAGVSNKSLNEALKEYWLQTISSPPVSYNDIEGQFVKSLLASPPTTQPGGRDPGPSDQEAQYDKENNPRRKGRNKSTTDKLRTDGARATGTIELAGQLIASAGNPHGTDVNAWHDAISTGNDHSQLAAIDVNGNQEASIINSTAAAHMALGPICMDSANATGKWYVECEWTAGDTTPANDNTGWGFVGFGFANQMAQSNSNPTTYGIDGMVGFDLFDDSWGTGNFATFFDGTLTAVQASFPQQTPGDGTRYGFAIDFDNELIWCSVDGVWEEGNPVTPTGGKWPTDPQTAAPHVAGATPVPWIAFMCSGIGVNPDTETLKIIVNSDDQNHRPTGYNAWLPLTSENGVDGTKGNTYASLTKNDDTRQVTGVFAEGSRFLHYSASSTGNQLVRTNYNGKQSGKWYFEVASMGRSATASTDAGCGIVTAAMATNDQVQDVGVGMNAEGRVENAGVTDTFYGTSNWTATVDARTLHDMSPGDVMMVAIDFDNGYAWFGMNGVWFNSGDPTDAGTTGISFTVGGVDWFPATDGDTSSAIMFANLGGQKFIYTIPTGYGAWDGQPE